MSFLFFIVPVLIVAGAFLWLKPSLRDQQLAKLRSAALLQGFKISSLKVPDLSEYGRVNGKNEIITLYEKGLRLEKSHKPTFTILRTTGESGAFLPNGWTWGQRAHLTDEHYKSLVDLLNTLPVSISVVCLMNEAVALNWDEKDPDITFDYLNETLHKVANLFQRIPI